MPVAKNKVVVMFFFEDFHTVSYEPFFVVTHVLFFILIGRLTTFPAKVIGQADSDIRRKHSKQPLTKTIPEDLLEHFISMIAGSKTITVRNKELLVIKFKLLRLKINGDIKLFLKIISHPHIVISDKKM